MIYAGNVTVIVSKRSLACYVDLHVMKTVLHYDYEVCALIESLLSLHLQVSDDQHPSSVGNINELLVGVI